MTTLETPPGSVAISGGGVTIPYPLLARWVGAVAVCTPGKKSNRSQLRYISIETASDGSALAVATDTYCLAALKIDTKLAGDPFMVPVEDIAATMKVIGKPKAITGDATLSGDGTAWSLVLSDGRTFGGPVTGTQFPNWRGLIPTDTFEPATFMAETFGTVANVLTRIGDNAGIRWDAMQANKPASGFIVGGDGIEGRIVIMCSREGTSEAPAL